MAECSLLGKAVELFWYESSSLTRVVSQAPEVLWEITEITFGIRRVKHPLDVA